MVNKLLILFITVLALSGCKKILAPLDDNHRTLNDIYSDQGYAEGILMNAYTRLPTNGYTFSEVATDDAVTNDKFNPMLNMATGSWSAANNPVDQWNNSYTAILYLNLFLKEVDIVNWSPMNKDVRILFTDRLKGEVFGLRALFMYHLLQAHAGYSANGELLGVPIITDVLTPGSDFTKPRNSFDQCVQQIYTDLTEAEKYLPLDYTNITAGQLPSKYSSMAVADYNRVFGTFNRQRMSGRILKAIKARTALLAASPAFNPQATASKWEKAANDASEVINLVGGIVGLDPQGALFYTAANVNAIDINPSAGAPIEQKEMLWRGNIVNTNTLEINNFPPTLFGNGRVNPTQNLVDAFPMANGYPISNPASGYVATNPYANRDPRLRNYIVVNGGTISNKTIFTKTDAPTN
ncbi:MAG: RagB/SusD family nutrient uptake outer membrane protein, partial [Chitinophagaceae bacterium]|nr:RagB/SusD family nutrient uptake outer membrane protein [Chitinophagaceae bacterium]